MALFKILRGPSSGLDKLTINDGWCYYTPDTGLFYIDYDEKRIPLNAKDAQTLSGASLVQALNSEGLDKEILSAAAVDEIRKNLELLIAAKQEYITGNEGQIVVIGANGNPTAVDIEIPNELSDLTSDSTHRTVTDEEKSTWNAKANKSDIPSKVSELTNDKGYLTDYTETDPTVPDWAKAENKPIYNYNELEDRTHYEQTAIGVPMVILPETVVDGSELTFIVEGSVLPIIPGNTYKVTYNGAEYTLTAYSEQVYMVQLGSNLPIADSEPFMVGCANAAFGSPEGATYYGFVIKEALDSAVIKIEDTGEILSERTGTFGLDAPYPAPMALELGEQYIVTYDGIDYTCECKAGSVNLGGGALPTIGLGNAAITGAGENTGEPFVIANVLQMHASGIMFADDQEHTIRVRKITTNIKKLNNKFVDAAWIAKYDVQEVVFFENQQTNTEYNQIEGGVPLTEGSKVEVVFDGITYKGTAFISEQFSAVYGVNMVVFGDENLATYPFLIISGDGTTIVYCKDQNAHTVSVKAWIRTYNKLPKVYLDEMFVNISGTLADNEETNAIMAQINKALHEGKLVKLNNNETVLAMAFDPDFSYFTTVTPYGAIKYYSYQNNYNPVILVNDGLSMPTSLTLQSSTNGSKKKFRITVDDNGVLTTKEVTE